MRIPTCHQLHLANCWAFIQNSSEGAITTNVPLMDVRLDRQACKGASLHWHTVCSHFNDPLLRAYQSLVSTVFDSNEATNDRIFENRSQVRQKKKKNTRVNMARTHPFRVLRLFTSYVFERAVLSISYTDYIAVAAVILQKLCTNLQFFWL